MLLLPILLLIFTTLVSGLSNNLQGCCPPPVPKCCDPACPKCLGGPPPAPGSFCRWGCPEGKGCPGTCPCDECVCCYTTTLFSTATSTCLDTSISSITVTSTSTVQTFTSTILTTVESLIFTVYNVFDYTTVQTFISTLSSTLTDIQTELSVVTSTVTFVNSVLTLLVASITTIPTGTILVSVTPTATILTAETTVAIGDPVFDTLLVLSTSATLSRTESIQETVTFVDEAAVTATAAYDPPVTEYATVSTTLGITDSFFTERLSFTETVSVTTPLALLDQVITETVTDTRYSPTYKITISTVPSPTIYVTSTDRLYTTTAPIKHNMPFE